MTTNTGLLQESEEALDSYRPADFGKAEVIYSVVADKYDDAPAGLYAERRKEYPEKPPPEDRDGEYTAITK